MSLTKSDLNQIAQLLDLKLKNFASKYDFDSFATKDDLKNFATKDDLKNFATKDDLKNFATKDDLKNFATKDDFRKIKQTVDTIIDTMATKQDLKNLKQELTDKFSHLPTKDEFYSAMDKWMKVASTADIEKPLHRQAHRKIRDFMRLHSSSN